MGLAERLNQAGVPRTAGATAAAKASAPATGLKSDEYSVLKHEVHENLMQSLGQQAYWRLSAWR